MPVGDGGIVLGVRLGDGVWDHLGDHAAPGACLVHADPAAGYALAAQACVGNPVEVRTGAAAGETGAVLGKRGEGGRVIAAFDQAVLRRLRPGDQVAVRGRGQGAAGPVPGVTLRNIDPALLARLPVDGRRRHADAPGPGRAAQPDSSATASAGPPPCGTWTCQLTPASADRHGAAGLRLGDLVAIDRPGRPVQRRLPARAG